MKFRSKLVIEVVQWVPGKQIKGIQEIGGFGFLSRRSGGFLMSSGYESAFLVRPGDYIRLENGKADHIYEKNDFEESWENVGG